MSYFLSVQSDFPLGLLEVVYLLGVIFTPSQPFSVQQKAQPE